MIGSRRRNTESCSSRLPSTLERCFFFNQERELMALGNALGVFCGQERDGSFQPITSEEDDSD